MSRTQIVPATEALAMAIAESPRPADVAELWASSRSNPLDAMMRGMDRTVEPFVAIHDGVPVCMFGACGFSILGGMGAAWMIGSAYMDKKSVQKDLLRLSIPVVEHLQDEFPNLLYNFVDARNTASIRWLRWLGFQFNDPIPYGVDGLPFLPFYRRRGG